jgi:hypothetical protein
MPTRHRQALEVEQLETRDVPSAVFTSPAQGPGTDNTISAANFSPDPAPNSSASPASQTASSSAATQAPAQPLNLVATTVSPSEINLSWDLGDTSDTSILIQRKTSASGSWQNLVTLPGGENTYTDVSGWASTTYYYRVQASNSSGASAWSSTSSATTQAVPVGALATVTGLKAVANSPTTATISFTDTNPNDSGRTYLLQRSADGVTYQTVADLGTSTSWKDVGLTPGSTYYYRVLGASWDAPTSDYSAAVSVTQPARPNGAPIEASGLQVTGFTSTSATLSWINNDPTNPQFKVQRAVYDPWHPEKWVTVGTTAAGATTFTDTGLSPESAYVYRVQAVNSNGTSDYATPAQDYMEVIFGDGVGVSTASKGTGSPKTYDIGPGYQYQNLNDLNWSQLGPGDTVNIHYKAGGYHELLLISTRGTPTQWITINGVPDPTTGALPTIDGLNAVVAPQFQDHYDPVDGMGGIVIGTRPGYVTGYKPGYIQIQNLQIQDVYHGDTGTNTFTDYNGIVKTYGLVGAGVYIERGDNITVKSCTIDNNGEGVFGAGQSGYDRLMTNVTLDSNYIYNNGDIGSYRQHNTYLEGINTVYQYNHYGPTRVGSGGAGLKDRGVGTVIRYNYIDGGAHQLQLPEAQNEQALAMALPEYHTMYVYGNTFVAPPGDASSIIYYGGDQGETPFYRKGTLYLYNNTLVARSDSSVVYKITAVQLASQGETVEANDNIIAAIPNTTGASAPLLGLLGSNNDAYFGRNWVSPGFVLTTAGNNAFTGHAGGQANLMQGTSIDPGFLNLAGGDYRLAAGSPCIDAATRLPGGTANYPVNMEYEDPHTGQARPVVGAAPDLGAYEYGTYSNSSPPPGGGAPNPAPPPPAPGGSPPKPAAAQPAPAATPTSGTASWQTTSLAPGTYELQVGSTASAALPANTTFQIYDGSTLLAVVRIDPWNTGALASPTGTVWQSLGKYKVTSGTLWVVSSSDETEESFRLLSV